MSEKPMGRRAANKGDKLRRIRAAARELFIEKGYEGATMRDIAARSGVGFGTLFDYATNKRDLLFLIFNPELVATLEASYERARAEASYLDQAMKLFEGFYRLYYSEPSLARDLLRELNFYRTGTEAMKFMAQRTDFLDALETLTAAAQARGELISGVPTQSITRILFAVFAWEVRRWVGSDPLDMDEGLTELRNLIGLQVRGLSKPS